MHRDSMENLVTMYWNRVGGWENGGMGDWGLRQGGAAADQMGFDAQSGCDGQACGFDAQASGFDVLTQTFATNNVGLAATFHPFVRAMRQRGSGRTRCERCCEHFLR